MNTRETYQIVGQAAQDVLQALDDSCLTVLAFAWGPVKLECTRQDQQNTRDAIVQMQPNPSSQFLPEARGTDTIRADAAALARSLQFRNTEFVDSFAVNIVPNEHTFNTLSISIRGKLSLITLRLCPGINSILCLYPFSPKDLPKRRERLAAQYRKYYVVKYMMIPTTLLEYQVGPYPCHHPNVVPKCPRAEAS